MFSTWLQGDTSLIFYCWNFLALLTTQSFFQHLKIKIASTVPFRNKRPKIYAKYAYAYAYIRVCVCVYTRMRMRICAYTLCARMLISMYKLAGLFFLLLIVDCSFNDPTLRHLKVHGRMNKSCRAKESLHVYFYRKY